MFEGKIKKIDLENRSAIVTGEDGQDITVSFTERVTVEVGEEETVGWMGGELEDLEAGSYVELELTAKKDDGTFICDAVASIS